MPVGKARELTRPTGGSVLWSPRAPFMGAASEIWIGGYQRSGAFSTRRTFQSLLEQVRELHRLADEVTRERARFDAYVQARLRWDDRKAPVLPAAQRDLADEAVEALSKPRLSSVQSRQLYRAFFRKSGR